MSSTIHLSTFWVKILIGWLAMCATLASGPVARAAGTDVPALKPVFAGTPLPASSPINAGNIEQLAHVAQWGRGGLNAVAFAPDGQHFVVGSTFGIAIYATASPSAAPRWLPFDVPFWYNALYFSREGKYLLLEGRDENQVYDVADERIVKPTSAMEWLRPATTDVGYGDISVLSPDGTKRFKGGQSYVYDERRGEREVAFRDVYDTATRKRLYQLNDPVTYLTTADYTEPEGCEISFFSYCGNAYMPLVSAPFKGAFSPSSATLTIIYRPASLSNSSRFGTLRVYNADDGKMLTMLGSFDQPVADFAYAPDSQSLLVAFTNGSIQLWNLAQQKMTFGTWAFTAPIGGMAYTHDGKYLLVQYPAVLEIRRRSDGALWARYPAVASTLSPVENLLALAGADGVITLRDVNSGEVVRQIQAHKDTIFALAFSPDGQLLASSSQDCTIRLWDAHTGEFLHLFEETIVNAYGEPSTASRIFIRYLHFVPRSNRLIGFGSWGTVVSWNVNSGATQYVIESAPLEYYNGMMTLDPHFPEFFNADLENNRFYINTIAYNLQTGEALGEYQRPDNLPEGCSAGGELSADGTLRFTYGYDAHEGQVCVLDAHDQRLLRTLDTIPAEGREYTGVSGLALSPDGVQLAVSLWGGVVNIYQVAP